LYSGGGVKMRAHGWPVRGYAARRFFAMAFCIDRRPFRPGSASTILLQERGAVMGSTDIVRIVAGVVVVVILIILIQRRRTRIK
jgi:hypothetical protein